MRPIDPSANVVGPEMTEIKMIVCSWKTLNFIGNPNEHEVITLTLAVELPINRDLSLPSGMRKVFK